MMDAGRAARKRRWCDHLRVTKIEAADHETRVGQAEGGPNRHKYTGVYKGSRIPESLRSIAPSFSRVSSWFQSRLIPEIDALYELHKKNPGPDLAVPLTAFTFRNREVAKRYEASSDTIKALVEKYRTGDLGIDDEDLDDDDIEEDVDDLRVFLELEKEEKAKAKDTSVSSLVQYEQLTYKFR